MRARWYRKRVSTWWWLGRWAYLKFILRELSSLAVAYFVGLTLVQIWALSRGPAAYEELQAWLRSPALVALDLVALGFVLFHAVTWFNLAPRAMVITLGKRRVPDAVVAGSNYAAWLMASALVAWLVVGR